jgi:hypothetical protein
MQMGDMKLVNTKPYKYLGTMINENGNLTDHIKESRETLKQQSKQYLVLQEIQTSTTWRWQQYGD